ncbi:MAG: hydroxymethylglutaryl-CoA reductase [Candidatus Aenigmarchaeota archaeon]|nr:hydroxymethylglutaryl-CoA reductase [Candidatus Aenigmarchaeota archaeon]
MTIDKLKKAFMNNAVKSYLLEQELHKICNNWEKANKLAAEWRLELLEKSTDKKLSMIKNSYVSTAKLSRKGEQSVGIEQQIGGAVTPLALAGPLKISGEYAKGEFYIPIATNEAALVAGLQRGIKAVNAAGGINVVVTRDHMARAPLIECNDIAHAKKISKEIKEKGTLYNKMKIAAEAESKVSRLLDIQPFQQGRMVHLRFVFQTGDSMGMNSATKYSANALRILIEKYPDVKMISLTANMCSDKKASHINVLLGRGKSVETEIIIDAKTIKDIFGVGVGSVERLNYHKNYRGSALAGTISGFNANVANTIAAMFIATGQDAAQITESSSCFTSVETNNNNLHFNASFPCIELATTGGGADFGTAKECLEILGCYGPGKNPGDNVKKLAEIIAAAASCQDLNLLCAEANTYELADSHIRLARGENICSSRK